MRISIIILAAILAIIGIIRPTTIPRWLTIISIAIVLVMGILEIISDIRQSKQKKKEQYTNILKPKSSIILSSNRRTFSKLQIGDPGPTFEFGGGVNERFFSNLLRANYFVLKTEEGQIKLSMMIRDRTGKIVAEIDKNEWKVNPNNSFDRNYSKNALEVKDSYGDIILQVRLLKDRVQLQAKFYGRIGGYPNIKNCHGVEIGIDKSKENHPGVIHFLGPDAPSRLKFEPIFKYPSDHHLGEFVEKKK